MIDEKKRKARQMIGNPQQFADTVRVLPEPRVDPLPCEKCGWDEVSLRYCTWIHKRGGRGITVQASAEENEHLDAICERCCFTWRMNVLRPQPQGCPADGSEMHTFEPPCEQATQPDSDGTNETTTTNG